MYCVRTIETNKHLPPHVSHACLAPPFTPGTICLPVCLSARLPARLPACSCLSFSLVHVFPRGRDTVTGNPRARKNARTGGPFRALLLAWVDANAADQGGGEPPEEVYQGPGLRAPRAREEGREAEKQTCMHARAPPTHTHEGDLRSVYPVDTGVSLFVSRFALPNLTRNTQTHAHA